MPTSSWRKVVMSKYDVSVGDPYGDVSVEAVFNKLGGVRGAKQFLAGQLVLVEARPKPETSSEPPLDFTIRVDRLAKLTYPDRMRRLMHPELQATGPVEFDLKTSVAQWFSEEQKTGVVRGHAVYLQLKMENALDSCLGFADLLAIKDKGIPVLRPLYNGKLLFGWKSVVQCYDDDFLVPYLYEDGYDTVVVSWLSLIKYWSPRYSALRFGKWHFGLWTSS